MSWKEEKDYLSKTFTFKNFSEGLKFVNKVGEIAEEKQHHPDIKIFDYNNVTITTTTHDEGNSITDKDRNLAKAIDAL